jgi:hypothetical protein
MGTDLTQLKQSNKRILVENSEAVKSKKRLGRKPKQPEERQTEKVTINFTKAEKEKLLTISQEKGDLPLTILIKNLLKKNEWI